MIDVTQGVLDRLDLGLALRLADAADEPGTDLLASAQVYQDALFRPQPEDPAFLAALLRLRGFLIHDDDAAEVFAGRTDRLPRSSQEHQFLLGFADALQMLRDRASRGRSPDGWFLVELHKVATRGVRRFRNNALRTDAPWDGVLYVPHPPATEITGLVETFDAEHCFRDQPLVFHRLHPVRQSFRVLWRLARIAPFPDLNLPMAWLAMCGHLLAHGYPLLMPEARDREAIARSLAGPPPTRLPGWESRLLRAIGR